MDFEPKDVYRKEGKMKEYVYRFAFEEGPWTYSTASLGDILSHGKRLSRAVPNRPVLIQRVRVENPKTCFVIEQGLIQKGGRIC